MDHRRLRFFDLQQLCFKLVRGFYVYCAGPFAPAESGPATSTLAISDNAGSHVVVLAGVRGEALGAVTELSSELCTECFSSTCRQIDLGCRNVMGTVKINSFAGSPSWLGIRHAG